MANQKEIRSRISSTISTQQITKAMKLVSATKLRKASDAIVRMRPYAQKMKGIMVNMQDSVDEPGLSLYFKERELQHVAIVVVSSDRGLCGAFNANVVKRAQFLAQSKYQGLHEKGKLSMVCIGKKGAEALKRLGYKVDTRFMSALLDLDAEKAFDIGQVILDEFKAGQYDKVELVYNQFKNAATQVLTNEYMLPVIPLVVSKNEKKRETHDYIFEPSKTEIMLDLIPRSLKTQLYRAMLESLASEHGARMVAMDKATENAGELIGALKLAYNQARQAAITREISEIVGGVAALEG